jgi:hypothetical protein
LSVKKSFCGWRRGVTASFFAFRSWLTPDIFGLAGAGAGALRMIVALPDLPASVKDLLRHHSERLYRYSLPRDFTGSSLTSAAAS